MVQLVDEIDLSKIHLHLLSEEAGGIAIFIGTVRASSQGRKVKKLEFEAYEAMASLEMEKIRDQALSTWNLKKAVLIHALGVKQIQEPIVVTAAAAAHRKDSFLACQYMIDRLKESVPIWKKEYFEDGYHWVSHTP